VTPVLIGTSGWQYRDWRGRLYPEGLPQARWLERYAERFAAVEVNASFYRLPAERTFADWRARTPDGFVFAVKASRYLTHVRRLRDPEEPMARLLERARALGPRLGPLLLQLPPDMRCVPERLDAALAAVPRGVRVAVEPRHESWFVPAVEDILARHRAALCLADRRGPSGPVWRTAEWGYLRLHAGRATPGPCYGRRALATWGERLAERWGPEQDVYVFFNNDTHGCAVRDAAVMAGAVARAGLRPTRTPAASEVVPG
jgi:uncharacterized protein YecE (DUF72 family)